MLIKLGFKMCALWVREIKGSEDVDVATEYWLQ